MARKSKSVNPAERRNAALKEALSKQRKRHTRRQESSILAQARELFAEGEYEAVRELLLGQVFKHLQSQSTETLELLGEAAIELNDSPTIARVYRRLAERVPSDVHYQVNYAHALSQMAFPFLTLAAFERLAKNWPADPLAQSAGKMTPKLRELVNDAYQKFPWTADEKPELGPLHEEMLFGLAVRDMPHVIEHGRKLLAIAPKFPPAFNNLASAYRYSDRFADAEQLSQQVLADDPSNPHALYNLGDSLYAQGRRREARAAWERLRTLAAARAAELDSAVRQAEALSRLGDDAAVLDVVASAKQRGLDHVQDPSVATMYHAAGVAAARLGQHRTASDYWRRALDIVPNFKLAVDNLKDHQQPEGDRAGPWLEPGLPWLTRDFRDRLIDQSEQLLGKRAASQPDHTAPSSFQEIARQLADRYPELPDLIEDALLDGDPSWRLLAIALCEFSELPALEERLLKYALSSRGDDESRLKAVLWCTQKGLVEPGMVQLWTKGKQSEVLLLNQKIAFEGKEKLKSPEVEELHRGGYDAMINERFEDAEACYRKALAITGDEPTALFNLSNAIASQGRHQEAEAIQDDVIERWPDYFFGRVTVARRNVEQGRFEQAADLLLPLLKTPEFHISEYTALCFAYLDLEIARGREEAAHSWLEQLRNAAPDHPAVGVYERRLKANSSRIEGFFRGLLGSE